MAAALRSSAIVQLAWLIASVTLTWGFLSLLLSDSIVSVRQAILSIILTASTGNLPAAVSPDNMMASAPSKMALATSWLRLGFAVGVQYKGVTVTEMHPLVGNHSRANFRPFGIENNGQMLAHSGSLFPER